MTNNADSKKRAFFTDDDKNFLQEKFNLSPYPTTYDSIEYSKILQKPLTSITNWFKNERTRNNPESIRAKRKSKESNIKILNISSIRQEREPKVIARAPTDDNFKQKVKNLLGEHEKIRERNLKHYPQRPCVHSSFKGP